jgi:hypothetical protein
MLRYDPLSARPREFLAATSLTPGEFLTLLAAFEAAERQAQPGALTRKGEPRRRQAGAGPKGTLPRPEDRLLFILVYQKTHPLQTMHALQFGLSQPQAHHWVHRLLPVLQQALAALGHRPERRGGDVAGSPLASEGGPALVIDGTERRRQRPQEPEAQRSHYSGKKKAHTDKNLLVVSEASGKVAYLGPTEPGSRHDKRAADEAGISYPPHATLGQDTGFQGYAPAATLTEQPKKSRRAGSCPCPSGGSTGSSRACASWSST